MFIIVFALLAKLAQFLLIVACIMIQQQQQQQERVLLNWGFGEARKPQALQN